MEPVLLIAVFVAGFFAAGAWSRMRGRSGGKLSAWLVTWSGESLTVEPAKIVPEGVQLPGRDVMPAGVLRSYDLDSSTRLYFAAVDAVALADHKTLERARRTIVLRALFSGGGDLLRYLQMAAVLVPLAVSIWLTMAFGGVEASLKAQAVDLGVMRETLEKPLVVQGAE
jgi:hypothetical protein